MFSNVQSIGGKIGELCCVASDLDPDILLLTETWCNNDTADAMLSIPGYDMAMRQDRIDTHHGIGGGLLVFIKPNLKIVPVDCDSVFNQYRYCTFKSKFVVLVFVNIQIIP